MLRSEHTGISKQSVPHKPSPELFSETQLFAMRAVCLVFCLCQAVQACCPPPPACRNGGLPPHRLLLRVAT